MRKRSKRYNQDIDKMSESAVPLDDAIKKLKSFSKTKFDQTVELVCHLGIDPKHADQAIRGSVSLPKGIGKTKRVIAFCPESEIEAAKAAGAVEAGADELVAKVAKGWTDFDVAVAHPSVMGKVGKLGRVLGPRGLMPNPRANTVLETADIARGVKEAKAGRVEFRLDRTNLVHCSIGKASFSEEKLVENLTTLIAEIAKAKPSGSKGQYIRSATLSSTMGASISIDTTSLMSLAAQS